MQIHLCYKWSLVTPSSSPNRASCPASCCWDPSTTLGGPQTVPKIAPYCVPPSCFSYHHWWETHTYIYPLPWRILGVQTGLSTLPQLWPQFQAIRPSSAMCPNCCGPIEGWEAFSHQVWGQGASISPSLLFVGRWNQEDHGAAFSKEFFWQNSLLTWISLWSMEPSTWSIVSSFVLITSVFHVCHSLDHMEHCILTCCIHVSLIHHH